MSYGIRRKRVEDRIIDRWRRTIFESGAERDGRSDKFALIIPLIFIGARSLLTPGNNDRQDEIFVVRVFIPLITSEVGGEKLRLPFIVPLPKFDRNVFLNAAVSRSFYDVDREIGSVR